MTHVGSAAARSTPPWRSHGQHTSKLLVPVYPPSDTETTSVVVVSMGMLHASEDGQLGICQDLYHNTRAAVVSIGILQSKMR